MDLKDIIRDFYKDEVKYIAPVIDVFKIDRGLPTILSTNLNYVYEFIGGEIDLFELFRKIGGLK